MGPPVPDRHPPAPAALFAAWLGRAEAGEPVDFEALCREHPQHAAALRELHAHWSAIDVLRRQHGLAGALADKLRSRFGSDVDPQVTLEAEDKERSGFSSQVLSRLAGRGPASTRYRIRGEVGQGGMGTVLRVWDEDLRRHLAMKVILGKGGAEGGGDTPPVDPKLLARFLEEAQVTGQLDHPGIVPVHELGLDAEGRVYFTMKLVKGTTLKDVLDDLARGAGGWTQARVLGLLLKVCEAMSYAHAKGVIHRDLKPANVMVGSYGEVYVMDWGLAKVLARPERRDIRVADRPDASSLSVRSERGEAGARASDSPLYTLDGDVLGTPAYMPPEQARGDVAAMGPQSDVYAVGAMLYHLLAGHMPYVPPGTDADNHSVWRRVMDGPPQSLASAAPRVPLELAAICERAMARDPRARYAEMAALAEDLAAFSEGRVVRTYESGTWAETRKWVRRNKSLASALAATVVAVLMGGIAFAVKATEATRAAEHALAEARRAEDSELLARAEAARAEESERAALAETAKVLRLSDVKRLADLEAQAEGLGAVAPEALPALESWLQRAQALLAGREAHRATLDVMRGRALASSGTEQPDADLHDTEAAQRQVEARTESSAAWKFDSTELQWHHDVLAELVRDLDHLEAGLLAPDVTSADFGWSVAKRASQARALSDGFAEEGALALEWSAALPSILDVYPGLALAPQVGLVPLARDPQSGLWEFWHVLSGARPQRGSNGAGWAIAPETGVVLVLIPAGSFAMGAQASDPQGQNYDPLASSYEGPVHERRVEAFCVSKYELTQAQWERLTGHNPSQYSPRAAVGRSDVRTLPTNPVERVNWKRATAALARFGLALPTEAEWEYAARAGTSTPWWTGADKESLLGAANIADQAATRSGATWQDIADWPELDDGYPVHAPVDTFAPNAFGLHHVAGNVRELCADDWVSNWQKIAGVPGGKTTFDPEFAVFRGGNFGNKASNARSSSRGSTAKEGDDFTLGLRPVWRLE